MLVRHIGLDIEASPLLNDLYREELDETRAAPASRCSASSSRDELRMLERISGRPMALALRLEPKPYDPLINPARAADLTRSGARAMNEDVFNMSLRKFLKKVGVTSQREIEKAVRSALDAGRLKGSETLDAEVTLKVGGVELSEKITGKIELT